ncbi:hypothetical protein BRADI_1g51554v3 [Brachypodium distachyon]|uniref:Uncharacterized protein n=1 Tax=Brachypodium distachyon TaxID=15368 RepID=A0A0Q3S420_BRADI|nr:hypothetical protein BRADI_1g51554v3 [Brachypodium distachyon]
MAAGTATTTATAIPKKPTATTAIHTAATTTTPTHTTATRTTATPVAATTMDTSAAVISPLARRISHMPPQPIYPSSFPVALPSLNFFSMIISHYFRSTL